MKDEKLRGLGFRVTVARVKILGMLEAADPHHLSAEDIYQALHKEHQEIGLATVYRVLTQFEQAGLVKRHNFEGGFCVFEIDTGEHHDHMVCVECGHVEEFVDAVIENRQDIVARDKSFQLLDHTLTIYGICEACQQKSTQAEK